MGTTTEPNLGNRTTGDQGLPVVALLESARALIEKPENWANHCPLTLDGKQCAVTAVHRAADHIGIAYPIGASTHAALTALYCQLPVSHLLPSDSISGFNDSHDHADVLALYDRAIEAERAKSDAAGVTALSPAETKDSREP